MEAALYCAHQMLLMPNGTKVAVLDPILLHRKIIDDPRLSHGYR
jgi:hypothetical protein